MFLVGRFPGGQEPAVCVELGSLAAAATRSALGAELPVRPVSPDDGVAPQQSFSSARPR